jgi:uncharacterized protein YaaN involved in tellurite resistance
MSAKKEKIIEVKGTTISSTNVAESIVESQETMTPEIIVQPRTSKNAIVLDQNGKVDLSAYSPTEIEKFQNIGNKIKTNDNTSISNYGVDVQNKLGRQSDAFLTNIKTFDAGEIGGTINNLLSEINMIDIDATQKSGLQRFISKIPFINKLVVSTKKIFQQYDAVSTNVGKIVSKLEQGILAITKDNVMLGSLFDQNVEFIGSLEELIISGRLKHEEMKAELAEMEVNINDYQDYEILDKRDFIDRLGKRLHDMELTRVITIQSLPQIRLVQNNNATMAEKVHSSITTTIPVWKQQIAIAVTLMRQEKMAEVQEKMYDATNKMLVKNAELLRVNSIEIAKQNERGVVDVASLRIVQDNLIQTIDEIKSIKAEGENTRKQAELELRTLETTLQDKIQQLN